MACVGLPNRYILPKATYWLRKELVEFCAATVDFLVVTALQGSVILAKKSPLWTREGQWQPS